MSAGQPPILGQALLYKYITLLQTIAFPEGYAIL